MGCCAVQCCLGASLEISEEVAVNDEWLLRMVQ